MSKSKTYQINFADTDYPALTLPANTPLELALTQANSPVLFGCRSGICGTCLIAVEEVAGHLPPPSDLERDTLDLYVPHRRDARLACQLKLTADIKITCVKL